MIGIDFSDRLTFDTQAFLVAGPTVWNSLPDSLRDPAVEYCITFSVASLCRTLET